MRIIKIEHSNLLDAVQTEYDLDRKGIKSIRLDSAVVALENMHNVLSIKSVISDNKGVEVEASWSDINTLNKA